MSVLVSNNDSVGSQLGLSSFSVSSPSIPELSEHNGNSEIAGGMSQSDLHDTTFTSSPYTEPKQGFLCLKFLRSNRKQMIVISTSIIILTVGVAILPPILFAYVTVWPLPKHINHRNTFMLYLVLLKY